MQFVPLWTCILKSRKVGQLPAELFRFWILCLVSAQDHDHRRGTLPHLDDLAYSLHMDLPEVESLMSRLVTMGFVTDRDGSYAVHDWQDWKYQPDPTAAERKRRQRAKKGDPESNGHVTDVTDVTENHACHALTEQSRAEINPPTVPQTGDVVVAFGMKALGDTFELEAIPQKLAGWRAAGFPDDWIQSAMLVANCSCKPGGYAAYMNTCLRKWKKRGSPDPDDIMRTKAPPVYEFATAPPNWNQPSRKAAP